MEYSLEDHLKIFKEQGIGFEPYIPDGKGGYIKENGEIPVRNVQRERRAIDRYLESLEKDYVALLHRLEDGLPAMAEECRAVVLAPARFEAEYIDRFLEFYSQQRRSGGGRLPLEHIEILVLNNLYENETPDNLPELVRRRKEAGKDTFPVHLLEVKYKVDEPYPLTLSRRIVADVALLRASKRPRAQGPLYLISEDVDTLWMPPQMVDIMISTLDAVPWIDSVRGQQDRAPWIMKDSDALVLMRRSWNFSEAILTRKRFRPGNYDNYDFNWNRITTSGWNTAITAEVYAMIYGYTPHRRFREDVDIGEKISCLRGRVRGDEFVPLVDTVTGIPTRVEGSPRRWLLKLARDVEPYDPKDNYKNFFDLDVDKAIRELSSRELLEHSKAVSRIGPSNIGYFEELLGNDYSFLVEKLRDEVLAQSIYETVLYFLGFEKGEAVVRQGKIEIRKTDNIKKRLAEFRERNACPPKIFEFPAEPWRRRLTWRDCR